MFHYFTPKLIKTINKTFYILTPSKNKHIKCRGCSNCKENESIEAVCTKEEVEQHLINQSVHVDVESRESWATLPLLRNPKMQLMGFVAYVKNLNEDQQQMLKNNIIQNFIAWRAVWNGNSLSTNCRLVFDASQPTKSGYSSNNILAKGTNNMNKLVEILTCWTSHLTAFHTDIRKMYNAVKLE